MLPEAIILAVCAAIQAGSQVALKAMEGQTPDQRAKMWDWFIHDMENWRQFWGIDKAEPK